MALPTTRVQCKDIWIATFKFNAPGPLKSWTEKHCVGVADNLPGADPVLDVAEPSITQLINFRLPLLGLGIQMVSASLSTSKAGTDADEKLSTVGAPVALDDEDPIEAIDVPGRGPQFRLDTATRHHAFRDFPGVRDATVIGNAFQVDVSGFNLATHVIPGSNVDLTAQSSWLAWMAVVARNTLLASWKNGRYTVEPWSKIRFKKIKTRRLGAIFGGQPTKRRA